MCEAAGIRDRLETVYRVIERDRMNGVPILNPVLSVAAIGFDPVDDYALGVLLTPWFMNLLALPLDPEAYAVSAPAIGETVSLPLPAGRVDFIVGYENALGYSLACSLFSPVFMFPDQQTALQTAHAALAEVMNIDAAPQPPDQEMADLWAGKRPERVPEATPAMARRDVGAVEAGASQDAQSGLSGAISRRDMLRGGRPDSGSGNLADRNPENVAVQGERR